MINPQFEIDRLKRTLIFKGLDETEADQVGNLAMQDINTAIDGLVAAAVDKAAEIGMSMGAEDFVQEIQVINYGGIFKIGTSSGKTDFSLPPFPMLPRLLKNAKVAKDGSLYKVIPVGKKSKNSNRKKFVTLFDVQMDINKQHIAEQEQRKSILQEARKLTLTSGTGTFTGLKKAQQLLSQKRSELKQKEEPQQQGEITFRTASSKQNPSSKWVLPEKNMNMKLILDDINRRLEVEIQDAIGMIVRQYEELI